MKNFITLMAVVLISAAVHARGNDTPATIFFHDGTSREGLLRPLKMDARQVSFKADKTARVERFPSRDIARIRIFDEEDNAYADLVFLPWHKRPGRTKLEKAVWLTVVMDGHLTLYHHRIVTRTQRGATVFVENRFLVRRADEAAPTYITTELTRGVVIGPTDLVRLGWRYFENFPELAERIRNREFENNRNGMKTIVMEYNIWASQRRP